MIGNGFDYFLEFESGDETGSNGEYGKYLFESAAIPPLYGFIPDSTNVMNETTAVSNVVEQYVDNLTYGNVDPDTVYPEFLQALKDAGIDKIIAEYQAQADAWLKS
jgi:putative aldouronate transport system substrate-binding protein